MTFSLLFVDDHPLFREGLALSLAQRVPDLKLQAVGDLSAAYAALRENSFDLCLTDQRLPDGEGVSLVERLRREQPLLSVGILCADLTPALSNRVRALGGAACLSKARDPDSIAAAVIAIAQGAQVFDTDADRVTTAMTTRRQEILQRAAKGMLDKQIGVDLGISESTVRHHWQAIFEKLKVSNRTEAVTKALRLGLL